MKDALRKHGNSYIFQSARATKSFTIGLTLLCGLCALAFDHWDGWRAGLSKIFQSLFNEYDTSASLVTTAVVCIAAVWKRHIPVHEWVKALGAHPISALVLSTIAFSLGSVLVYGEYPLSMDEYAAVYQAKIFAAGHVFGALPPKLVDWLIVSGFNGEFFAASRTSGKVIEEYWPTFALMLSPFEFLRIPWLCNALLGGVSLYLIQSHLRSARISKRLDGRCYLPSYPRRLPRTAFRTIRCKPIRHSIFSLHICYSSLADGERLEPDSWVP